jgi:hypothetical protein
MESCLRKERAAIHVQSKVSGKLLIQLKNGFWGSFKGLPVAF